MSFFDDLGGKGRALAAVAAVALVDDHDKVRLITLGGIGWPTVAPEFDPYAESELVSYDVCDLVPGTKDGFPEIEVQVHYDSGPDPPSTEYYRSATL